MKIYINDQPGSYFKRIFIVQEPGKRMGDVGFYLNFNEKGEMQQTQIVRNGAEIEIPPTLYLSPEDTHDLVQAFLDYAKSQGMEAESESKAKGKLEATEYHLEDLRTLLKLNQITHHEKRSS